LSCATTRPAPPAKNRRPSIQPSSRGVENVLIAAVTAPIFAAPNAVTRVSEGSRAGQKPRFPLWTASNLCPFRPVLPVGDGCAT